MMFMRAVLLVALMATVSGCSELSMAVGAANLAGDLFRGPLDRMTDRPTEEVNTETGGQP